MVHCFGSSQEICSKSVKPPFPAKQVEAHHKAEPVHDHRRPHFNVDQNIASSCHAKEPIGDTGSCLTGKVTAASKLLDLLHGSHNLAA